MKRNTHLTSTNLKIVETSTDDSRKVFYHTDCHWMIGITDASNTVAGLSACQRDNHSSISGVIILENSILEIEPLLERQPILSKTNGRSSNLHLVKRSTKFPKIFNDFRSNPYLRNLTRLEYRSEADSKTKLDRLTLEVAMFFDEAAYSTFAPYYRYDSSKITDLLLAYLNGVQALYYHRSLGQPIDIVLVYLEIMKNQPTDLPTFEGERSDLLDSFCTYQQHRNTPDGEEGHWDMALYISGLDFFAWESGKKNSATMGLATVGGVCLPEYNCITAEFGVTNQLGRPFPSAGFTSVYILAHEIGHNLGMSHDATDNDCPKDGFIMSPSRGTQGETVWSKCSAEVVKDIGSWAQCLKDVPKVEHEKYNAMDKFKGQPGRIFTAKKQCEILLV